jgi:putative transposase
VAAELKPIYGAATSEEAQQRLARFAEKWDGRYPSISQIWRRNWEQVTPFFAYPTEIRKVIYTTNAVESLNMSLRKVIKTRGSFPNEEAATKLLYLALERAARRWTRPVADWKAALNRFAILYEDRLPRGVLA